MSSGIYIASAGAVAQSRALDTTANNIANASTAGFRSERITFREALTQARSPEVAVVGAGTARVDSQAGALTQSDNPLDLALEGDGYFGVQSANGPRYTRAGNFRLDDQNRVVNADGLPVRGEGGATITIPPNAKAIAVSSDGSVSADGESVGKLELVRFAPAQMQREGSSLFSARGNPMAPDDGNGPKVRSGMLESSNFNAVRGVVDLVKVSRTYESMMRVIQRFGDIENRAARDLGGPNKG